MRSVDDMQVRHKLLLFLLLPILTVLFFSVAGISERASEARRALLQRDFASVAHSLIAITEALQDERSLAFYRSIQMAPPGGGDSDTARQATDAAIEDLSLVLEGSNRHEYFGFRAQFVDLVESLRALSEVRRLIDTESVDPTHYFNAVLAQCLHILGFLVVHADDASLVRSVDRLVTVLELADQASLERDLGLSIVAAGRIGTGSFQAFSAYVANQRASRVRYELLRGSALDLDERILDEQRENLVSRAINRTTRSDLLSNLSTLVTLGESLNAIVPSDGDRGGSYREAIAAEAASILARLRGLAASRDEIDVIDAISRHLDGEAAAPVGPLIRLLESLSVDVESARWLSVMNERITFFRQAAVEDRDFVVSIIETNFNRAAAGLAVYLVVAALSIGLSSWIGYLLGHRLITGIGGMSDAMRGMRTSGKFAPLLEIDGDDELTEMAAAFNQLVEERLAFEATQVKLQREVLDLEQANSAELERKVELRTAQLEEAMRAAESANEVKSRFLGNMSHHVRTPLNAIQGYTQLIMQGSRLAPQDRKQLEKVQENGKHLLDLMEDILDMVRFEKGEAMTSPSPIDPRECLTRVAGEFAVAAHQKGLELWFEGPDLPDLVVIDRVRIEKILSCLLDNAVKFTRAGSVRVVAGYRDGNLRVDVSDTGIGMTAEEASAMALAFDQALPGCESTGGGVGLGLALVSHGVRLLGGSVRVDGEHDVGTTVSIEVPAPTADVEKRMELDPSRLMELPPALRDRMRDAVAAADMLSLSEVVAEVEALDEDVARALDGLIKRYDYDSLGRLVDQH